MDLRNYHGMLVMKENENMYSYDLFLKFFSYEPPLLHPHCTTGSPNMTSHISNTSST